MSAARLTSEQEAAWRGFHDMRNLLLPRLARELAADSGLTEADYAVLVTVVGSPEHTIRSTALLEELGWEPSRLSHQIARMEARGSISRLRCSEDARSYYVRLTPGGLEALRRATPGHISAVRRLFVDALTPAQLESLTEISAAIASHITSLENTQNTAAS